MIKIRKKNLHLEMWLLKIITSSYLDATSWVKLEHGYCFSLSLKKSVFATRCPSNHLADLWGKRKHKHSLHGVLRHPRKDWEQSSRIVTALAFYFKQNSWVTKTSREKTAGQGMPLRSQGMVFFFVTNKPKLLQDDFPTSLPIPIVKVCWFPHFFSIVSRFNFFFFF